MENPQPLVRNVHFTYNKRMNLRFDEFTDRAAWELFVVKHAPQSLFQSWLWGEVQRKLGGEVRRYGLYEGDVLRGIAQTVLVRARRGSFLHVRHGPILDSLDPKLWKLTADRLCELAKKQHCLFVRISPLVMEPLPIRTIPSAIHRMDGEYCWVLDLEPAEDALLAAMRKSTRYDIRKAQKDGATVLSTTNPTLLSEFFSLYKETSTRHGFVPHTGIREEFEIFFRERQAVLYVGKYKGKTTAAAVILFFGNQAIYHHGASIHSETPVSAFVQWEAIKEAKKRGMKVYNFWGIAPVNNPNHPWRGITLFKKGFGGREVTYLHAQDIPVSPMYIIPRTIELVRRKLRGYD